MIRNTVCLCNLKLLWSVCSLLFPCQHCPPAEVVLPLSPSSPPAFLVEHNAPLSTALLGLLHAVMGMGDVLRGDVDVWACLSWSWGRTVRIRTNSSPLS